MSEREDAAHHEAYTPARTYLQTAAKARDRLLAAWNGLNQDEAFSLRRAARSDGTIELGALAHLPHETTQRMDAQATEMLWAIKDALDAAIYATAKVVCSSMAPIDPDHHRMPLAFSKAEFDTHHEDGCLLGLRPDQVRVLEELQPFAAGTTASEFVGKHMTQLAGPSPPLSEVSLWCPCGRQTSNRSSVCRAVSHSSRSKLCPMVPSSRTVCSLDSVSRRPTASLRYR